MSDDFRYLHGNDHEQPEQVDYKTIVALQHECQTKEVELQRTNEEIRKLQLEVERLRLEKRWCYDESGKRTHPTAEQLSLKISQQLVECPEYTQDVVKRLRMIRIDLQCSYNNIKQKSESLKEVFK